MVITKKRLAIVTTHPVQYYAPVFKLLHERNNIVLKVFYTWAQAAENKLDPGFGKIIEWDLPLLSGYDYEWVNNTSKQPGSHHRKGIVNPQLIDKIRFFAPDAVLVFGWAYVSHLKVMRHFKGKTPVYFRGDSTLLDEKKGISAILKTLYLKWVYNHVDHAFYVGTNNKAYFLKYGLQENQLSFAPHAVDNDRFAINRTDEVRQLKEQLGIGIDETIILFAGKFEDKKSPGLLLDAFTKARLNSCHLLFVGNGILESVLKSKANINLNIHFLDFQNQQFMPVVYQACDIFCLPSGGPGETWGLAVNEAMACGKAVLVSDKVGCAIDLVENGSNGYIFKSGDIGAFVNALIKLSSVKDTMSIYGNNSIAKIQNWSFLNVARSIEAKLQ